MRSASTLLVATLLSTSAIIVPAALAPAAAQVNLNFGAPPAPQFEAVPAPRPGYAWAPGSWQLQNNRHVWEPGRWMEARQDQHWVPDRWESYREGGQERWRHQAGRWDHDDHRGPAHAARPDRNDRHDRDDHHDDHRGLNSDRGGKR
jgi:hypothetical protein